MKSTAPALHISTYKIRNSAGSTTHNPKLNYANNDEQRAPSVSFTARSSHKTQEMWIVKYEPRRIAHSKNNNCKLAPTWTATPVCTRKMFAVTSRLHGFNGGYYYWCMYALPLTYFLRIMPFRVNVQNSQKLFQTNRKNCCFAACELFIIRFGYKLVIACFGLICWRELLWRHRVDKYYH